MNFIERPRQRKLLNYDRIVESCKLTKDKNVYICCSNEKELFLQLPDTVETFDNNFNLPLENEFGNLRRGVFKIVNIGEKPINISFNGLQAVSYKDKTKKFNKVKIYYGEDKFFLKNDNFWFVY